MMTPKAILLIEDHSDSANSLARILGSQGHSVSIASTMEQARTIAGDRRFDVAVCDLGLPDGDGCDLMRELAAQYGLKGVALTGFSMPEDITRAKAAGFSAFVLKPVAFEKLLSVLEDVSAHGGMPADHWPGADNYSR